MSVQFGRWNFGGETVEPDYLKRVQSSLAPYGPDGCNSYQAAGLSIQFHSFHTTAESRQESQPHVSPCGNVLTWDGRLDNRADLICNLRNVVSASSTDIDIVSAAFDRWATDCFSRLIGDWALAVWNPEARSVILAKDFVGTRQLYYSVDKDHIVWSTILDPLVTLAGKKFALCEEYLAGWFSYLPAAHLTPYVGINAVPPCSYLRIRRGQCRTEKYWNFDHRNKTDYRTDREYEEHFRAVFAEAVSRRLRSDSPVLAELSGGMDSASVVCIADTLLARGAASAPRLDTISYYDDTEPNWNERPYFSKVEELRGRLGCHIDVSSDGSFRFDSENDRFVSTPSSIGRSTNISAEIAACIDSGRNRVLLSGIGGDEVTGGVPTPTSELQDLVARGQLRRLATQLATWALVKKKPWFHLLFDAVRDFVPGPLRGIPTIKRPASWLDPDFVKRNRLALQGYENRLTLWGPRPSFQNNLDTLNGLRRQLGCSALSSSPTYEKRYPYLDRDFLEFVYSVPRDQLVRPGQRRSLMRRALIGIVPPEILQRNRKAFISRSPIKDLTTDWFYNISSSPQMFDIPVGIVDARALSEAFRDARLGRPLPVGPLMRTIRFQLWLKAAISRGLVSADTSRDAPCPFVHNPPDIATAAGANKADRIFQ